MNAILAGLLLLSIGLVFQRTLFWKRERRLRATEQAFGFHAIRDEVQELAVTDALRQDDPIYRFVMWTANLCIKNAGVLRLRDTLRLAKAVGNKAKVEDSQAFTAFILDIQRRPEPVQRLIGKTFYSLAEMLMANDPIVRVGVIAAFRASRVWATVQPSITKTIDRIAAFVIPERAEAVSYARKYRHVAGQFAA